LLKFTKKAEIGLDFFQTQAVFELDRLKEFIQYARKFEAKVIIGVRLLTWEEIVGYRDGSLPGVLVPASLIDPLRQAGESEGPKRALELTANLIKEIKAQNLGDGIHLMAMGQEHLIPEILTKVGL
jgi:5,10-methylenetetrahydrofolate reductase